jgi:hypothetical protein
MATRRWTLPARLAVVGAPLLGSALAGCGGEPRAASAPPPTVPGGTVAIGVTTPDAGVDPELVDACVEWVQFQAYVGDPEGVQVWEDAGQTDEGLTSACGSLVSSDPDRAGIMRDQLDDMAASASAAEASTTLAPGCHASYGDCLPIVTDIDCQGSGDGPVFVAISVIVFGDDVYELDQDEDGLACEPGDR